MDNTLTKKFKEPIEIRDSETGELYIRDVDYSIGDGGLISWIGKAPYPVVNITFTYHPETPDRLLLLEFRNYLAIKAVGTYSGDEGSTSFHEHTFNEQVELIDEFLARHSEPETIDNAKVNIREVSYPNASKTFGVLNPEEVKRYAGMSDGMTIAGVIESLESALLHKYLDPNTADWDSIIEIFKAEIKQRIVSGRDVSLYPK